jgi:hypothetical protein
VSKQATHRDRKEWFNLKELKEVEGKEQHHVEISNRLATLKILDEVDINRYWETIRENTRISTKDNLVYSELK